MKDFYVYLVLPALICMLRPITTYPQPGFDSKGNRSRRDISCNVDLEYPHGSICCLNCPAGKYVKSACTKAGETGACEECHYGTYAEHANGLQRCFRCTQCHSDQEVVRPCSPTLNTECQCKPGLFCHPDEACEVCKKCSSCESDEEVARNCTATTNTECKKIQPKSSSTPAVAVVPSVLVVIVLLGVMVAVIIYWKKYRTGSRRNPPDGTKPGQEYTEVKKVGMPRSLVRPVSYAGIEDEHKMLCETPDSSASNSQHSLTSPPCPTQFATLLQANPAIPALPDRREDDPFPTLVPVNGEVSLRQCFHYFEDVDVDHHKRFFRHLGFSDNAIKSKDNLTYEDKIHELLNMWMEREGREASLNDLLKALLDLNQRRTAELVKEKALYFNHYVCEC